MKIWSLYVGFHVKNCIFVHIIDNFSGGTLAPNVPHPKWRYKNRPWFSTNLVLSTEIRLHLLCCYIKDDVTTTRCCAGDRVHGRPRCQADDVKRS